MADQVSPNVEGVAIIGMAGRFPGADNAEQFWQNLCEGVESIKAFGPDEDRTARWDPAMAEQPNYVRAGAFLRAVDKFDARFFGYSAREAELLDPQQRLLLECAWQALEDAGYDARRFPGRIGVFAGSGANMYAYRNIYPNRSVLSRVGSFQALLANERDYVATRVSYKLGLTGPSMTVQTACSTALVAVVQAYQNLLQYNCDMALAGGVSLLSHGPEGYLYEPGGILSPDGHCRAFDEKAQGMVVGNGLGVVVLKRLEDAVADGDTIYAVIKGAAVNNDGDMKAGYTAPSVEGQTEVIMEAMALAGFAPDTIGYVEAHGTGTNLGDPIEIAALTQAFRAGTDAKQFCAIGSVKTNIGHLDAAAGVAGLIKAALSVKHGKIPPSLHFERPNPRIDFANSPVYVNAQLRDWPESATPRRAGVSSFGIGGTNAHVVLEEPPVLPAAGEPAPAHLLVLSAKTPGALEAATTNLADHLDRHADANLSDVAYTLLAGRREFPYRRTLVCRSTEDAVKALRERDPRRILSATVDTGDRTTMFVFPGQGVQYLNLGRDLYEQLPGFRRMVDRCADLLQEHLGFDIRTILYADPDRHEEADKGLQNTMYGQAALFVTEYALASWLMEAGVQPECMIGYSFGEYVAACLAGVFSLEDGLRLVVARGRLMAETQPGAMLAVALPEEATRAYETEQMCISGINGPMQTVLSGARDAVHALKAELDARGVESRVLNTTQAFHSHLMDPILERFRAALQQVRFHAPQIPYVSSLTGTWIRTEEATDPAYWVRQLRGAVRFADGLQALLAKPLPIMIEIGPAHSLASFLRDLPQAPKHVLIYTMRHHRETVCDTDVLLGAVGRVWLGGGQLDPQKLLAGQSVRRVPLPTYAFERQRYWIEAVAPMGSADQAEAAVAAAQALTDDASADADPGMVQERFDIGSPIVAPRTETEARAAAIWQEALGAPAISVYDNFFELGGHSLLAIRLVAQLREAFGVELSLQSLFEHSTVAELAALIDQGQSSAVDPIAAVPRTELIRASFWQERCWRMDQKLPAEGYKQHVSFGWEMRGNLDPALFEASVKAVVARHESLRTGFAEVDGQVFQVIAPSVPVQIPVMDLRSMDPAERERFVHQWAYEEGRRLFDMAQAPLWRMILLRLEDDLYLWVMVAHRSIWDGSSTHEVMDEIAAIQAGMLSGRPAALPELPIQYADYSVWERKRCRGELYEKGRAFFRDKLGTPAPFFHMPGRRKQRPEGAKELSAVQTWHVPQELSGRLRELARQCGTTLFVTMVAGLKAYLYQSTGVADLLLVTSFNNRERKETMPLVGWVTNYSVLRTDLSGEAATYRELIDSVREGVSDALANREFPFVEALAEFAPEVYWTHKVLSPISIAAYEGGEFPMPPGVTFERRLYFRRPVYEMFYSVTDLNEGIQVQLEYDTALYDETAVDAFYRGWERVLADMVEAPGQTLPR
jgi:acyl transferase domain-containing protein